MFKWLVVMGLFKMHISLLKVVIGIIDTIFVIIFIIDLLLYIFCHIIFDDFSSFGISYVEHVFNILSQHSLVNKIL